MSDSFPPLALQHSGLPHPSLSPRVCSNSSWWCHPAISSYYHFSSCTQSFIASESFPMSWLFTSGDQSIGVLASASVLSMNIQDWYPLGLIASVSSFVWFFWPWGMWGLNFSTRNWTHTLCIGKRSLNHQTPRDVPTISIIGEVVLRALLPSFWSLSVTFHLGDLHIFDSLSS